MNVWCVLNGTKYSDKDVYILRDMVDRHLEGHDFWCLSDRPIRDVNYIIPPEVWPGWWSKLLLFRYARGQVLYLDLDVVITGPLEPLLSERLSMPANWAQSGHGGCQSSVMSWAEDLREIPDRFNPIHLNKPSRGNCGMYVGAVREFWGDQEFITEMLGDPGGPHIKAMPHVYSYKYHCKEKVPADCAVVSFHGDPKPDQVNQPWVKRERSYTAIQA